MFLFQPLGEEAYFFEEPSHDNSEVDHNAAALERH